MTITIGSWFIPVALTLAIWFWGSSKMKPRGDYDFSGMFYGLVGIAAICFVWAVYFGVMLFMVQ